MKKHFPIICALLASLMILGVGGAYAKKYELSPALEIIVGELEMKKCTVTNREVKFEAEDFEETLGRTVEYITISALPEPSVGVLKYAGNDVYENQSVSRKNLSLLKFVPGADVCASTSFSFFAEDEQDVTAVCTVSILDKVNLAPTLEDTQYNAMSGIGLVKSIETFDPEGDAATIEITKYPKNGIVSIVGECFTYTSEDTFEGSDSFSYRAKDVYGNVSDECTAVISVEKPGTKLRYDDMAGHWGYTSALALSEMGLMGGAEKDGKLLFYPDQPISRGDFLAMAMIAAGLEEKISLGSRTTFADDCEIPSNIKSYASYAMASGIISGYVLEDGSAVFGSGDSITRAEAASVLSKLIGSTGKVYENSFVDAMSIPEWAKDSFNSLVSIGVISGNPGGTLAPERELTRAEAAQLLCNTEEYLKDKAEAEGEKKGFFGKLLGIFG